MSMRPEAQIQIRHPQPGKAAPRIARAKYVAIRDAILRAVPREHEGMPFRELPARVARLLPRPVKERLGSVTWYTVTVKLDLEARRILERVPGSRPQRIRRRR